MILESSILLWPGAHFKWGPWAGFITRCWDLEIRFWFFSFWEFISGTMSQIWTFLLENGSESISNNSKIIPESFPSNFHVIFTLRSPQTINFQLKLHKKLKSKPELCQVGEQTKLSFSLDSMNVERSWSVFQHFTAACLELVVSAPGYNRPPKGDRSEGFYRFLLIFINFHQFSLKII